MKGFTCCIVQQSSRQTTYKDSVSGRLAIFSPISPTWVPYLWVSKLQNQSLVICNYMEMSCINVNMKVTAASTDYSKCLTCLQVFLLHLN